MHGNKISTNCVQNLTLDRSNSKYFRQKIITKGRWVAYDILHDTINVYIDESCIRNPVVELINKRSQSGVE